MDIKSLMKTSKINFVDLSGAERGVTDEGTSRIVEEGNQINKSLFALSKCINALVAQKLGIHIPYRDSKLTRFLKDSLGGSTRTVMICHVSPNYTKFRESVATLKYAELAKFIPSNSKDSLKQFKQLQEVEYKRMVQDLKQELELLKTQRDYKSGATSIDDDSQSDEVKRMLQKLRYLLDESMDIRKNICDVDAQNKMNELLSLKQEELIKKSQTNDPELENIFQDLKQSSDQNGLARAQLEIELEKNQLKVNSLLTHIKQSLGQDQARAFYGDMIRQQEESYKKMEMETNLKVYEEMNNLLIDKVLGMKTQMQSSRLGQSKPSEPTKYSVDTQDKRR